jgi:hypothetical protein
MEDHGVITLAANPICNTIQQENRNKLSFVSKILAISSCQQYAA